MSLATAILLLGLSASPNGDPDLDLASALARRGWVDPASS